MKRILVFGLSQLQGGVEVQVMNFYRHFDRARLQCDFLCYDEPPCFAGEIEALGGRVYIVTGRGHNPVRHEQELRAFFRSHAGEYAALWCNLCTLSDVSVLRAAKQCGLSCRVIHSHNAQNMGGRLTGFLHNIHKRKIGRLATDYWACSNLAGQFFYDDRVLTSTAYHVVHNAIDTDQFRYSAAQRLAMRKALNLDDAFVIGHVGRFHLQKNHAFVLEVFQAVYEREPRARLLLVGDGALRMEIEEKLASMGLTDKAILTGVRDDVAALMQAMDVFVLPSRFEGLGIVAIEAQAAGLPCIAADVLPDEAAITPLFQRLPLGDTALWANTVLAAKDAPRADMQDAIVSAGYDISTEAKTIQDFFEVQK